MPRRPPEITIDYSRKEVWLKDLTAGDTLVLNAIATLKVKVDGVETRQRYDWTGHTFLCQVKRVPELGGGDNVILQPEVELFSSADDAVLDQWQFVIEPTDTRTTLGPGAFAWEIEVTFPSGQVKTLAGGDFTIVRETAHA